MRIYYDKLFYKSTLKPFDTYVFIMLINRNKTKPLYFSLLVSIPYIAYEHDFDYKNYKNLSNNDRSESE